MEYSPMEFAAHLLERAAVEVAALEEGLERVAMHIQKTAKSEFGVYQPERGPFNEWDELADSTKADRVRQGYSENDPLFRSGALRDSIQHEVHGLDAVIGSKSDIMAYQEFGTEKIPPRPVLGPAALRNKARIESLIGAAAVMGIVGGDRIHESLGYDFNAAE